MTKPCSTTIEVNAGLRYVANKIIVLVMKSIEWADRVGVLGRVGVYTFLLNPTKNVIIVSCNTFVCGPI